MKSTSITMLVYLCLLAQPAFAGWVEYVDTFTASTDRWPLYETDSSHYARIADGQLVFHGPKGHVGWGPPWMSLPSGDFDVEVTLKVTPTGQHPMVALLFGLRDVDHFYFWHIGPKDGGYEYGKRMHGKHLCYHRASEGVPAHEQLKNRTIMKLKISRRGDWLELFQEDMAVDKFPFEQFFGASFGFGLHQDLAEIRVDHFAYRAEVPFVPDDETVRVVGNIKWPGDNGKPMTAYVHTGDQASVSAVTKGANQHLEINMAELKIIHGQTVGVSLQTTDGATLKVVCEDRCPYEGEPVGRKIHMITMAGNRETRRKTIDLPARTLRFTLTLDRKRDQFMGSYNLGAGAKLIGSLKWPKLSTEQTNTCYFGFTRAIDFVESPDHVEMTINQMSFE